MYFLNVTESLGLSVPYNNDILNLDEMVTNAIEKDKNHPGIKTIKTSIRQEEKFRFSHIHPWNVKDELEALDPKKSNSGNIPIKIIKDSKNIVVPYLTDVINAAINNCCFPNELKVADVSPCYKKGMKTEKSNYRPISALPAISKIFERLIASQINRFLNNKWSSLLTAFRKGHSAQGALLRVIESWRKCLDASGIVGTVLMDLSKAYDFIVHDLLIAKLEAYGFDRDSLRFMYSYLTGRGQRVKVGSPYSSLGNIKIGVPQGSVLGPMLLNIFINDLFLIDLESEICNFADDNKIFTRGNNLEEVIIKLEGDLCTTLKWFFENGMVANPEKFQLMNNDQKLCLKIDDQMVNQCQQVKLLGVTIDSKLNFDEHILELCCKVNKNVSAFSRIRNYLDNKQADTSCKTTVLANFNYCPLILMFSPKAANNEINRTVKRALRVPYKNNNLLFNKCLMKEAGITINVKNLQKLMLEVFKTLNYLNPSYLWDLFSVKQVGYNLRTKNLMMLPQIKTQTYGVNSITFRGSILWNALSDDIKTCDNVVAFRKKVIAWKGEVVAVNYIDKVFFAFYRISILVVVGFN